MTTIQTRTFTVAPTVKTPTQSSAATTVSSAFASQDAYKPAPRQQRYDIVVDLVESRLYVLNKATREPVARYLVSPGNAKFPTQGDKFTIAYTATKAPWNPPKSDWAKNAKVAPGGINNPMGIFKMSLGGYSQFIHGVPKSERKDLGRPASHGCIRMSNENVLQLYQQYAGKGSEVTMLRDAAESQKLKAAFEAKGLKDHDITDGKEFLTDAMNGKAPKPVS